MPLVHIVLFEFKPSTERSVIQDVGQFVPLFECGATMRGLEMEVAWLLLDPCRAPFKNLYAN